MDKVIDIIAASNINESPKHFQSIYLNRVKIDLTKENVVNSFNTMVSKIQESPDLSDEVTQLLKELSSIDKLNADNDEKVNNLIKLLNYTGLKLLMVIRNDLTDTVLPDVIRSYAVYKPLPDDLVINQVYLVAGINNSYENPYDLSLSNLCMDFLVSSKIDIPISEENKSLISYQSSLDDYVKLNEMNSSIMFNASKIDSLLDSFGYKFFFLL